MPQRIKNMPSGLLLGHDVNEKNVMSLEQRVKLQNMHACVGTCRVRAEQLHKILQDSISSTRHLYVYSNTQAAAWLPEINHHLTYSEANSCRWVVNNTYLFTLQLLVGG